MRKAIFLEYKFGDYDTKTLYSSGANEAIAWMEHLNASRIKQLKEWKVNFSQSFSAFHKSCPLDPKSKSRLGKLLDQAVFLKPYAIWLDHFRFEGHWENIDRKVTSPHRPCLFCRGKDRSGELLKISKWIRQKIPANIQLGYFSVPYETTNLGQDSRVISKHFDFISPMLYQRMISEPTSYISKHVSDLRNLTSKPIIPIIQTIDMPDSVPDQISESVLRQEYSRAVKPPSAGVAWFSWDGAVDKKKSRVIAKIPRLIKTDYCVVGINTCYTYYYG